MEPKIQDSGARKLFSTGATRDIRVGKGRMDLMPLEVVTSLLDGDIFMQQMEAVQDSSEIAEATHFLKHALKALCTEDGPFTDVGSMILEVSMHMEEGAEKYGANNWRKGIPGRCYFDSALRHYIKHLRGDEDERHDRATAWNLMCLIWELHAHDQNQYNKEDSTNDEKS